MEKPQQSPPNPTQPQDSARHISLEWTAASKQDPNVTGFLDLPRELRDKCYREALCVDPVLYIGIAFFNDMDSLDSRRPCSDYLPKGLALLSTCKQLHSEAVGVLYGDNHLRILCSKSWTLKFLTLQTPSEKNNQARPAGLKALPFHATYQPYVRSVALYGDFSLQCIVPMMTSLWGIDGVFFQIEYWSKSGPWDWSVGIRFATSWGLKDSDRRHFVHTTSYCGDKSTLEFGTTTGHGTLEIMRKMAVLAGMAWTESPRLSSLDDHLYKVQFHACGSDLRRFAAKEVTVENILNWKRMSLKDISCVVMPVYEDRLTS